MKKIHQIDPNLVVVIQSRAEMRYDVVDEYAAMMQEGTEFDPCQGCLDSSQAIIYVWDGAHRTEAAKKAKVPIRVHVEPGTQQDAEWKAFSANAKHGLRRTHKDIERAVKHALKHPRGQRLSDREIARHCGVHHSTVGKYRHELVLSGEIRQVDIRQVTRTGTTYRQNTRRIGKTQAQKPPDIICLFCQQADLPIYPVGTTRTGICLRCAQTALRILEGTNNENTNTKTQTPA